MNIGRFAVVVSFVLAMICMAAIEPAQAVPAQNMRDLVTATAAVQVEPVGCNCVRRVHRHRVVRTYQPDYATPVYPAPPVGLSFRKIIDAGFF